MLGDLLRERVFEWLLFTHYISRVPYRHRLPFLCSGHYFRTCVLSPFVTSLKSMFFNGNRNGNRDASASLIRGGMHESPGFQKRSFIGDARRADMVSIRSATDLSRHGSFSYSACGQL